MSLIETKRIGDTERKYGFFSKKALDSRIFFSKTIRLLSTQSVKIEHAQEGSWCVYLTAFYFLTLVKCVAFVGFFGTL